MTPGALTRLLLLLTVGASCIAVQSASLAHSGIYSHAQCTVPLLDEQPATHYRGHWGPREFLAARAMQRVCLYSNVCFQLVTDSGQSVTEILPQFFVPRTSVESSKNLPPQYLGFEGFSHSGHDFEFDVHHEAVPADYAWGMDAGIGTLDAGAVLLL